MDAPGLADIFDGANLITGQVAVSPANSNHFAVGTNARGLYITQDGGQTFTNWTSQLAPLQTPQNNYRVSAMEWTTSRLVVAITSFGVSSRMMTASASTCRRSWRPRPRVA